MRIYKLVCVFVVASTTVKGIVYLGCFEDNRTKRVLPHVLAEARNNNTPGDCARRCSDYIYSGVEYWWECYCGNTLNATAVQEKECWIPCPGNHSTRCGGYSMISIYTNLGTETVSTASTASVVTTNSSTNEGSTTAVYVGIGVAVGLVCTVGAVIVIIVLRRRGAFVCKNGKITDTNDTSTTGSHTLAIRPHDNTSENHIYFMESVEGTVDHYNSANEPTEGNCDIDHYYSTEVTEQTYERMKDGNDEYDHTTNTLSSESDSKKRDNIYNKLKTDQHGDYDQFARPEHNISRPGNDYDTTYLASMNDGVGDYNHIVSTTVERVNGAKNREHGGYDCLHGIKTKLPPCDDTDYAHAKI